MLDHDASHRLGQRPANGPINILRAGSDAERPTNAHNGQVVFVENTKKSWIWSDNANDWEPFAGGFEFYAQGTPPASAGYAALWLDTAP